VASQELEKSLRAEVDSYINSRLSGLHEEITLLQGLLNESFSRLLAHTTGGAKTDTSFGVSILEHIRAAHERGIEDAAAESPLTQASSDIAILKASIEELDDQRSQTDVLNTLVNRAASFAPRIAFFVVKNDQTIGWRARGLQGTVGDNAVRDIALPLSSDTVLSDVVKTRATWSGSPGSHEHNHLLLSKLGEEPPQRMVAIPLIARGKAAAVLYADSAALESSAINLEALEALVRVAGMAVELLAVMRPAPAARPAPRIEPLPRHERPAPPQPIEVPTEVEVTPEAEEPFTVSPEPTHEPEEVTLRDVEKPPPMPAPIPPTPEPVAEGLSPQFSNPLGTARRYTSGTDTDLPIQVSDDEMPQHVGARRFAHLLVSEIKLYNEQKVRDGREDGDLYSRLREAIDRSREMYDKRYAATVGSRYDYFHHELVKTLAEGDETKLGQGYPGASVSV
jgi:GAF domain-containing protein